ncbi:hypothetical protein GINT2_000260 [Glugoides intestinalis]
METMVSTSNNIEQVTFLWQKLIWSNQPGALLSTVLFIEMSIAILFIMTLLKEKEKEKEEKYYYNNLSNSCLTILLVIISGIIFGKGVEIFFRTLHICSGAYGNVVFSLADIFMSLSFGCIFVISGYFLLFNKKLYKLLRLQTSEKAEDTELKKMLAKLKKEVADYKENKTDKNVIVGVLKEIQAIFEKETDKKTILDGLEEIVGYTKTIVDKYDVKVHGPDKKKRFLDPTMTLMQETMNLLQTTMNDHKKIGIKTDGNVRYLKDILGELKQKAGLEEIVAGLEAIVAGLEAYKAATVAEFEAKMARAKAIMADNRALMVNRFEAMMEYLELKILDNPEVNVPKLQEIMHEINETANYLKAIMAKNEPMTSEFKNKKKKFEEMMSKISEKLSSSELNEAELKEIKNNLKNMKAKIKAGEAAQKRADEAAQKRS